MLDRPPAHPMTATPSSTLPPDELAESLFQPQYQPLLRAILDNAAEGLAVADAKGRLLYFNDTARKILGVGLVDAAPEAWSERYGIFYPDTKTRCPSERLPIYRALQGEPSPEEDLFMRNATHPEGRHVHSIARPVRDSQGNILGVTLSMRDTHEQRMAEADQRRTELRFQLLVESAQEGLWTVDVDGRTIYANRYLCQMLGYAVDEMTGKTLFDVICPEDIPLMQQYVEQRRQGRSAVLNDFRLVRKDGTVLWTLVSTGPLYDETGKYIGAMAMITDITQRRQAEEQVRQLNAELERRIAERTAQLEFSNRELEAFAYSVAHDLRAPLRSISNFTLALSEDCADKLDATGLDYLQRIRASSQRMAELIDGILALSRVNRTEFVETEVNLSGISRSISEQLQRWQPERAVRFQLQDGLVDRGDSQLLRLVLENLMGNAWKFTREKPVAEIEFGTLPESGTGTGRVYFVRDNGAGFDMEYQKKLFGVFQRLHTQQEFEGNGVGLATVQRIIRRHGGRVWGEGRVGQGAAFYFTLHETLPPPVPPSSSPSDSN
ncbi:PAS domain S-box-containing protein [Archangium gephyra]|uniref:histidine kinase n=1 Tax=Archangium gephyra TaxID=48 RepID=A0ABX9JXK2_9BACT|nr:PAS domain S-box protein [Archangium gephyra]REG28900.1 PAS domain S-box-containing protein [Archangium gephyra]